MIGALEAAGRTRGSGHWKSAGMEDVAGLVRRVGKATHSTATCSSESADFCSTLLWTWQTPTGAFQ